MTDPASSSPDPLAGERVLVMGLGRFGGGVGVSEFLVRRGAEVCVTDRADRAALARSVARIEPLGVRLRLGGHDPRDFRDADRVVVNPAVPPDHPLLAEARAHGARISTEIGLLLERLPSSRQVIGVSGTAGKSTVTAMIGHLLRHRLGPERAWVGGNLGGSLLPALSRIGPEDPVVLELSSFMLERLRPVPFAPAIAVVTSFSPNHLDWHGTLAAYRAAKRVLFAGQDPARGDRLLVGPGTAEALGAPAHAERVLEAAPDPFEASGLEPPLPGAHNRANAALALAAAGAWLGAAPDSLVPHLWDFAPLPSRLAPVAERDGVRFIDDSKSTTPEAARLAIESFPPGRVHVMLGGYDKGADLAPLAQWAAHRCAGLYTIGTTGPAIASAARAAATWGATGGATGGATIHECGTLERAVACAAARAAPGEVVLLSPACASWDQFDHYEHRGRCFAEAIARCTGGRVHGC